jgi:hypothetical protein
MVHRFVYLSSLYSEFWVSTTDFALGLRLVRPVQGPGYLRLCFGCIWFTIGIRR